MTIGALLKFSKKHDADKTLSLLDGLGGLRFGHSIWVFKIRSFVFGYFGIWMLWYLDALVFRHLQDGES